MSPDEKLLRETKDELIYICGLLNTYLHTSRVETYQRKVIEVEMATWLEKMVGGVDGI